MRVARTTGASDLEALEVESINVIMKYTCSVCSAEFVGKRHKESRRVYCSVKCFKIRPRKWTERNCLACLKAFRTSPNWIKRGGGKYCSWRCNGLAKSQKIAKSCELCSTVFTVKPSTLKHNASRFCSHECARIGSLGVEKPSIQGEKSHFWKGGIQFDEYPSEFNSRLKDEIRFRDGYVCQGCGMENEEHILLYGYNLTIHHIDYVKFNCSKSNLITTCTQCNSRANFNKEHWIEYFTQKLQGAANELQK